MLPFPLLFAAIYSPEEDRRLVERLRNRDAHAMADLYDRYGRVTYALILRMVKDTGAAEDLVQETFLRIWNRVHAFDAEKGALGPWVMTVARNRAIDYVRSIQGRMAQSATELDENERPALFSEFEAELLNSDRARRLRAAFQKLTDKQRLVIEMAYYEGLSQTEMAARMQQPLGTIKTWTRAALRTLREELTEAMAV